MKRKVFKKKEDGYTIIETMIAVTLFLIIVIYGMGALLNTTLLQKKSADARSIIDNINFIMEEIGRNIRTGHEYHCITDGNTTTTTPLSCSFGEGISFKTSSDTQLVYNIFPDGSLGKSIDGGNTFTILTPPEVILDSVSGFSILGAEPPTDEDQPLVRIRLDGEITSEDDIVTPFSLQTSVSQRIIDI